MMGLTVSDRQQKTSIICFQFLGSENYKSLYEQWALKGVAQRKYRVDALHDGAYL